MVPFTWRILSNIQMSMYFWSKIHGKQISASPFCFCCGLPLRIIKMPHDDTTSKINWWSRWQIQRQHLFAYAIACVRASFTSALSSTQYTDTERLYIREMRPMEMIYITFLLWGGVILCTSTKSFSSRICRPAFCVLPAHVNHSTSRNIVEEDSHIHIFLAEFIVTFFSQNSQSYATQITSPCIAIRTLIFSHISGAILAVNTFIKLLIELFAVAIDRNFRELYIAQLLIINMFR